MSSKQLIKIAVIGPESTGKSALSQFLARELGCAWVPEFARTYCENLNRDCTLADEINIFKGQLRQEEDIISSIMNHNQVVICDTTIITVKVWCEHVFGECPIEVLQELKQRKYDLYLLCNTDIPWEDDPLRNFPELRDYFFDIYLKYLEENDLPFKVIKGIGNDREQQALQLVSSFIKQ